MNNLEIARNILKIIGMPEKQQNDISSYTFLALANITKEDSFNIASNNWIRIHDIIEFINVNYDLNYAENTRETIRKDVIHQFRDASLIEDNNKPTNSPNYRYRLTNEFLSLIKDYGTDKWEISLNTFLKKHDTLIHLYSSKRELSKIPIKVNGINYKLSPGKHNKLQKAIIEEFASRFAQNSECLYVGDTTKKDLVINENKLNELGFEITLHEKMPDVVLYSETNNWIYFIEAVTSVGPMSPKRLLELNNLTKEVKAGKIFVTAFLDFKTFKKFATELAWETEVWIASDPNHLIHLNGDKFLGPR